jgi:hypothetical protein
MLQFFQLEELVEPSQSMVEPAEVLLSPELLIIQVELELLSLGQQALEALPTGQLQVLIQEEQVEQSHLYLELAELQQ